MAAFALTYVNIAYIVAVVFAIIELGLTAYITSTTRSVFGRYAFSSPRVNFMVFNSVWSLLVLVYVAVTPIYLANLFHKLVATGLTTATAIFWFAGSIALAVVSGGGVVAAAAAFGFFLWVIFTGLAVIDLLEVRRGTTSSAKTTAPAANPGV